MKGTVLHQKSTSQRCRSETENFILEDLFDSLLPQLKNNTPSGNLKFNNLGIFQSLKFRIFDGKLNFTPNTLGFMG